MAVPKHILTTIVIAQFFCTSLWFAGNGVMSELMINFELKESALGYLTSAVQFGFITGTLIFAVLSIADRHSPSKVFFVCALLGALFNLGVIWEGNTFSTIILFRFLTGFFLAGIYPVGMKIAADYFDKGLGKSLGFLVGALVVGTALPHLLRDMKGDLPWETVLIGTSSLAFLGGLSLAVFVPNGPYRKPSQELRLTAIWDIFKAPKFRAAAFGYFGHMWELYAFWAFVPVILASYIRIHEEINLNISLLSFIIIAIGGLSCVLGGYLAQRYGEKKTAFAALLLSCCCCLISPFMFSINISGVFILFLLIWGMAVIADSPLFSTLVAKTAPVELKGTALTIVNCIGFAITIFSIQLLTYLNIKTDSNFIYIVLAMGPILGLTALRRKYKTEL